VGGWAEMGAVGGGRPDKLPSAKKQNEKKLSTAPKRAKARAEVQSFRQLSISVSPKQPTGGAKAFVAQWGKGLDFSLKILQSKKLKNKYFKQVIVKSKI